MGESKQKQQGTTNSVSTPWAPAQGNLVQVLNDGLNIYNKTPTSYNGNLISTGTQSQRDTIASGLEYANGAGRDLSDYIGAWGQNQLGTGQGAQNQAMAGLSGMTGDRTQAQIDAAKQFVAGADVDGLTKASMRDAYRNVREGALPALNLAAARSGNGNSDRAALVEGTILRGLSEQEAANRAKISSDLYTQGLSTAGNNDTRTLSALSTLGGLGTAMGSQGVTGANAGLAGNLAMFNLANSASTLDNALVQAGYSNDFAKFGLNKDLPWQNLNNLYNISAGVGKLGGQQSGTSSSTTTSSPSTMSLIGQGMGIFGSLFG